VVQTQHFCCLRCANNQGPRAPDTIFCRRQVFVSRHNRFLCGLELLLPLAGGLPRLELIWADSAYLGPLQTWVQQMFGWRLQLVERPGGRGHWLREGPAAARAAAGLPAPTAPLDFGAHDRVDRAQPADEQGL
jgi:hypothetical protein